MGHYVGLQLWLMFGLALHSSERQEVHKIIFTYNKVGSLSHVTMFAPGLYIIILFSNFMADL